MISSNRKYKKEQSKLICRDFFSQLNMPTCLVLPHPQVKKQRSMDFLYRKIRQSREFTEIKKLNAKGNKPTKST